ncbi:DNA helicase [Lentibacillus sp. JNUCC-1]|uniref:UvrD-helicase domain-containing protein n=1 Tax=Lentibacillus sp. JNUCC-1 TaxID=2654513 RepID=UPI0012E8B02A|nr:ATP-dependent helicase [Lentibacillus sp. JNUCC-1]MUV38171.1 DNA helicase [Lentibacillus sp. JNUCC-1]
MNKLLEYQNEIIDYFNSDIQQLSVIQSVAPRFIVEAPAGYGKTKVLINKVVYDLLCNKPKNHEKVLMITFSINSTSKMKQDIEKEISCLPDNLKKRIKRKVKITNYHGLARLILRKYGVEFSEKLLRMEELDVIDDEVAIGNYLVSKEDKMVVGKYNEAVKTAKAVFIHNNIEEYNNVIINQLLPNNYITHNGIITLTIQLLKENNELLVFYQQLFTNIVVDEFQDSNHLNLMLLELLLTNEKVKLQIYGDHLQRIYGFIGTVPNLFDIFSEKYDCKYYKLQTNYRFKDNREMLMIDNKVRSVASNAYNKLDKTHSEYIKYHETHQEEVHDIVSRLKKGIEENSQRNFAVLVPQRGQDVDVLINELKYQDITFYNALNIDVNHKDYRLFHEICASEFQKHFMSSVKIIKSEINKWFQKVEYRLASTEIDIDTKSSFLKLFKAFVNSIVVNSTYRKLTQKEKTEYILEVLLEHELSRYLSAIKDDIQILTIHSSKGLEWDEVFLMDMEEGKLPSWRGMCIDCDYKENCKIELNEDNEMVFIEQLSVFYVGVTRARERVNISASKKCARNFNKNISCLFDVLNIKPKNQIQE